MKLLVCIIGMALVLSPSAAMRARAKSSDTNLRLTKSIVESRYCSPDRLQLRLKLQFENVGSEPLILYKNSSVMGSYMVSRDKLSAQQKKYEIRVSPTKTFANSGFRTEIPNEQDFVVLAPNEQHTLEKVVHLSISTQADFNSVVGLGDHVLQLTVGTWYYLPEFANEFREKWKQKGILWSDPITSVPMSFRVESEPPVVNCSQ